MSEDGFRRRYEEIVDRKAASNFRRKVDLVKKAASR
jgi:hypothetical protein